MQEQEPSGTGFSIEVHSFPLDGRIVLFPADLNANADDKDNEAEAEARTVRPAEIGRNGQHPRRR